MARPPVVVLGRLPGMEGSCEYIKISSFGKPTRIDLSAWGLGEEKWT